MNWYLLALSVYLLLVTPLTVRVYLAFGTGAYPSGYVTLLAWHTGVTLHISMGRNEQGTLTLRLKGRKEKEAKPQDMEKTVTQLARIIRTIRIANHARHILQKGIHVPYFGGNFTVGLQDAAQTAQLAGGLYALRCALPEKYRKTTHVYANFNGKSGVKVDCILTARVGMLLSAMILSMGAYLRSKQQKQEEALWNDLQSET